eukprot:TRINITY_DN12678_c0_g1_i1.p3 TRINITY_DN12678_c0_g1~~TRINITY_DN12678_c0_g1_i1.p3  ORF type:complete len:136 (+),score=16.36 TRINITY_DN12678_c0_g1_i1:30-410(+)
MAYAMGYGADPAFYPPGGQMAMPPPGYDFPHFPAGYPPSYASPDDYLHSSPYSLYREPWPSPPSGAYPPPGAGGGPLDHVLRGLSARPAMRPVLGTVANLLDGVGGMWDTTVAPVARRLGSGRSGY